MRAYADGYALYVHRYADTFMAFGESHYGEDTGNPASSCMEAKFAENLGKRTVLLRVRYYYTYTSF